MVHDAAGSIMDVMDTTGSKSVCAKKRSEMTKKRYIYPSISVSYFHGARISKFAITASHYSDVIMGAMASQITSLTFVYSTVYSGADQRKHRSSASLAFVRRTHRWPVNSPHKSPVKRKIFPFDDVIMWIWPRTKWCNKQDDNYRLI